jgi:lipoyl(octanoyl) transferase
MLRVLIETLPRSGAMNMAIDEVLLESAIDREVATLRLYRWSLPTVSLGYFQPADDPVLEARFGGLARVRRLSGGGAILHDQEVTYSVAYPALHSFGSNPGGLYDRVHAAIVALLNEWGVPARLRGEAKTGDQPFLCFGRGDPRDIVLGAHKIVGSAQRRRRGAVLQHGALLLSASPHAPEFPGVFNLAPPPIHEANSIAERLGERIAAAIDDSEGATARRELESEEVRAAEALAVTRYASTKSLIHRS